MALFNAAKLFFKKHPLVANCCIYGTLYVFDENGTDGLRRFVILHAILFPQSSTPQEIDKPTLGRYAVMGTLIYSPILFNWYKWLDRTFPGTTKKIIVRKLLLDQFVLTPPLLVIFYTGMALMEMQANTFEECQKKFLPTFARSCVFWLPAQTINFLLIPPHLRVVYMGCASFLWVNILCYVKRQKLPLEKSN